MVRLHILNGSMAGVHWTARHLPVRVGRAGHNDLALMDQGVWDRHLTLAADTAGVIHMTAEGDALVSLNQQSVRSHALRVGDEIEIGAVRMRFSLAPPGRRRLGWREAAVWILLGTVMAAEIWLLLRLTG
jgi:hypothetical protein